jgi:uncharacterized RDD family membrane protein YckC
MSTETPPSDSFHGYLSEGSKRRFTLVAGLLGAIFFLAQFVLPMVIMFLVMMPMIIDQAVSMADLDHAAVWQDQLWFVERTTQVNWRDPEASTLRLALRHVRVSDLSPGGPPLALDGSKEDAGLELLPIGDRLWLIEGGRVSYFAGGSVTQVSDGKGPRRASKAFAYRGRPAVISLGTPPALATLDIEGARAEWTMHPLQLGLPAEAGPLRSLQAVEAGGGLYLVAELCMEEPERCSLKYRRLEQDAWLSLSDDTCSCSSWTAVALGDRLAVVLSERQKGHENQLAIVMVTPGAPRWQRLEAESARLSWRRWRALPQGNRLLVVSQGMPGSLSIVEVADGRILRSVDKPGSFPFGANMMWLMVIPQALPMLLSLLLAFVLTMQMRRHRVQDYVFSGTRRAFASLWRRALAQLVDLVPLGAGFVLPAAFMWRLFSDPESAVERGLMFPLLFFGLFAAAVLCGLLVLVVFSYFEGRFGKTPGKWLLRIRVLGTDLQPCGFGRALLRNLLTFVDGFFNFLVGVLLVALTENWQRLGDLAARTIVVTDESAPRGSHLRSSPSIESRES